MTATGKPLAGTAWMIGAIIFNTAELTLVHALGPGWPAPLQLLWRQGVALLLLAPFVLRDPAGVMRIARPGVMLFRSVAAMLALLLAIYAYSHLSMATANALSFTRPLWIVLLAWLVLRENVDIWRIGAVLVGFGGVLVMMEPDGNHEDLVAEAAILLSALLFAASFVSIKSMSSDNRTITILVYGVLFGLLLSAVPAAILWRTPTPLEALCLAGLGVTSLCNFACFANALKSADAAALVSLDYLRLPLATALGVWLFDEHPTRGLVIGALMIVAATASVTLRERIARRRGRDRPLTK